VSPGARHTGGGSSAVAASAHAGCQRFRHTDSLLIGMSRRRLAGLLGTADTTAGIPVARRIRAGLFERLVHADAFASRLATTTVGDLGLARPTAVHRIDCHEGVDATVDALRVTHTRALAGEATVISRLALPFPGMEDDAHATSVLPDFAFVASRHRVDDDGAEDTKTDPIGSWLIMGDAKDYERVRSSIGDHRMLKGFLQVAMGAEAADVWSKRPKGMTVHTHGALAVPRNVFLQPTTVTEDLTDHRDEVRGRATERARLVEELGEVPLSEDDAVDWVQHLAARFDPATCTSCSLFNYCRSELRDSDVPANLLVEIGVPPEYRAHAVGLVDETGVIGPLPELVADQVRATVSGLPVWVNAGRVDPAGQPGTVDVVVAKADSAATGLHGIAVRIHGPTGPSKWKKKVFTDPQSPTTRLAALTMLGDALDTSLGHVTGDDPVDTGPVHVVVPDAPTADLLVSIADAAAGVELSRLRWEHDLAQGREALTFDGEPATVPEPLTASQRLAASFLLEVDRARTMLLRAATVNLTRVVAGHIVPGGPTYESGRLDYLVTWATATGPLDHRKVSDAIAESPHTPGARVANVTSNAIHATSRRGHAPDPAGYRCLVHGELDYKMRVVEDAINVLDANVPESRLRDVYAAVEADAQAVWRRRYEYRASDLVRFSRTPAFWRNEHIDLLDQHDTAGGLLGIFASPSTARLAADDIGTRAVHHAFVASTDPLRVTTTMRKFGDNQRRVVAVTVNDDATVEDPKVTVGFFQGAFKLSRLPVGPVVADDQTAADGTLAWEVGTTPTRPFAVGDRLVVVDYGVLPELDSAIHQVKIPRPGVDKTLAPKPGCGLDDYAHEPDRHRWCCIPHSAREAETADHFAAEREAGRMNPQTWPPLRDTDTFDIAVPDAPTAADVTPDPDDLADDGLTIDDLD
jgi:hypothetical protein